jgi:hypothetical protein
MKSAIVEKHPMQFISVFCTAASIYYVGKLVIKDIKEGSDNNIKKTS